MPIYIDIPIHLLGTVTLLAAILALRALLDLEMGVWIVRAFHWLPTRWIFRHRYVPLKGEWDHAWDGEIGNFRDSNDRHGQHRLYQLFRWVYAGTRSKGRVFVAFGRLQGDYFVGRWYDKHDELGYFGAFQLRIVDSTELRGRWIGHSKQNPGLIQTGDWRWTKLNA